jgi:coenzyme F420-dependent glucose-6-phosphate dehydrogenase
MRALWSDDKVTFEGEYYSTHGASIYDRPDVGVPIYVAAGGPVVARFAGQEGDGFICTSGKGMELYSSELLPAVAAGAQRANRDTGSIDHMIEIKLSYDTDPILALENTRFWAPLSLSKEQKHDITDPSQMEGAADALPIEQVASRWIVGSDPEQVVERIRPYIEAGFNHLVFHGPGGDQERFMSQFERDLAPRLRELN